MLFYFTIWDGIPKFALFVAVAIILVSLADWLPKTLRNRRSGSQIIGGFCAESGVARLTNTTDGKMISVMARGLFCGTSSFHFDGTIALGNVHWPARNKECTSDGCVPKEECMDYNMTSILTALRVPASTGVRYGAKQATKHSHLQMNFGSQPFKGVALIAVALLAIAAAQSVALAQSDEYRRQQEEYRRQQEYQRQQDEYRRQQEYQRQLEEARQKAEFERQQRAYQQQQAEQKAQGERWQQEYYRQQAEERARLEQGRKQARLNEAQAQLYQARQELAAARQQLYDARSGSDRQRAQERVYRAEEMVDQAQTRVNQARY